MKEILTIANFAEYAKEHNISLENMSQRTGISEEMLYKNLISREWRNLYPDEGLKICEFLKVQMEDFFLKGVYFEPLKGDPGPSGPTFMRDGCQAEEYAELDRLCIAILNFLNNHPELISKVEITGTYIRLF